MNYLIIGESCIDVFIYGECKRFSPEAPVPVFEPKKKVKNYGMAHNVYSNVKAINSELRSRLKLHSKTDIITCYSKPVKIRYIDEKSNHMFIRVDENDSVNPISLHPNEMYPAIRDASDIIISDYNKGFFDDTNGFNPFRTIREASVDAHIYLDTKRPLDPLMCKYVDFIKLNTTEYNNQFKNPESAACLTAFRDKIIITDSTGATHNMLHYGVDKVYNTIDVSGAGDTFIAAFAVHYSRNLSVPDAIKFANVCASDVVSKRGVQTPTYNENWFSLLNIQR